MDEHIIQTLMKLADEFAVCYRKNTGFTASRNALRAAIVAAPREKETSK